MNKRLLASSLIALGLFLGSPADAQQVYVRNRPFKGAVTSVAGQIWVDLKSLAEALDLTLQSSESGGFILDKSAPTPEQLAQVGAGQVMVAGTMVESQPGADNSLLIPLKSVELLGARVTPNRQLNTIDVAMAAAKGQVTGGFGAGVRTINTPGAAVDVTAHLAPGIMNVVTFTAPW